MGYASTRVVALPAGALVLTLLLWGAVLASRSWWANQELGRGMAFSRAQQWEQAVPYMQSAVKLDPFNRDAKFYLGTVLWKSGRQEQGIAAYGQIAGLAPNKADVWDNTGAAYYHRSQYQRFVEKNTQAQRASLEQACQAYGKALVLEPGGARIHNNLGAALAELDQLDRALAEFKTALELDPSLEEAYNGLGNVLDSQHKSAEAAQAWERAMELKPDYVEPYFNLAQLRLKQGRKAEARRLIKKVLEISPGLEPAEQFLGSLK